MWPCSPLGTHEDSLRLKTLHLALPRLVRKKLPQSCTEAHQPHLPPGMPPSSLANRATIGVVSGPAMDSEQTSAPENIGQSGQSPFPGEEGTFLHLPREWCGDGRMVMPPQGWRQQGQIITRWRSALLCGLKQPRGVWTGLPLALCHVCLPGLLLCCGGHRLWRWAGGSPSCSARLCPLAMTRASDGGQTAPQARLPSALASCLYCLPWHKQVLWVCEKKRDLEPHRAR